MVFFRDRLQHIFGKLYMSVFVLVIIVSISLNQQMVCSKQALSCFDLDQQAGTLLTSQSNEWNR